MPYHTDTGPHRWSQHNRLFNCLLHRPGAFTRSAFAQDEKGVRMIFLFLHAVNSGRSARVQLLTLDTSVSNSHTVCCLTHSSCQATSAQRAHRRIDYAFAYWACFVVSTPSRMSRVELVPSSNRMSCGARPTGLPREWQELSPGFPARRCRAERDLPRFGDCYWYARVAVHSATILTNSLSVTLLVNTFPVDRVTVLGSENSYTAVTTPIMGSGP